MRRRLFLAGLMATACRPAESNLASPKALDVKRLDREITALADQARPGILGVGVMDLPTVQTWALNGERPFPMQSVFKAPLGAAVLAEVDAGRLNLAETVTLKEENLSPPYSPIADAWPITDTYSYQDLLVRAVGGSDNTAADVLMKRIGGPGAVQAWLELKGIKGVRIDRYEREIQTDMYGMASFRAAWKGEIYRQMHDAVPPQVRYAATLKYLSDPRDTATPRGMLDFLSHLVSSQLISNASLARLLAIMTAATTGQNRLKAGLPPGATIAHKSGTSGTDLDLTPATNDVGVVTLKGGRQLAVAVFLTASRADLGAREHLIAEVMRAIVRSVK
ncbi:beta-lactamase class A [Caulobacter ginsengisoli]|uniref:Beta-lactamase n=1 Tax=Caulobacter ginsengisoli TaxID=400775 RepID=A0ABU0IK87_9CAUL|nr:class A beta-lactamase [Caulobacter ginsengisoli]MDQ0462425.1 beta-lactamase class A [Caulobacter ginsengisoli]